MRRLTLQWRITILTAVILVISSVALTTISMINAEQSFMKLLEANTYTQAVDAAPVKQPLEGTVLAGELATPAKIAKRGFDLRSISVCILFTIFGTAAAYYAAGKAIRPVQELSSAVRTINERTLSQRLPEALVKDEVGALTDSFNEMLARLDDAFLRQRRFAANAAHELKTPLATLKTGTQVLSADKNAQIEDYQDHARKILTTVDRMTSIVDDLLLLASAGEGANREKEEVLLGPLFEAILNELSPVLEQRGIMCHSDCGELSVLGDASFLYRAFYNLVENSCKYGRQGGNIWINAKRESQQITVSVRDDGPGIAAKHLPYLFDAFYRVDKSRSRELGGAGLGLSLVKTMIEAEKGKVSVRSDGISGTCFTITLPA